MAVTELSHSYFMVWTPHGYIIDYIDFDSNRWYLLKLELVSYYNNYYLKTVFSDEFSYSRNKTPDTNGYFYSHTP